MKAKNVMAMLLTATLLLVPTQAAEETNRAAVCAYCGEGRRLSDVCGGMVQNYWEIPESQWGNCSKHIDCKTITIEGYTVARCTEGCRKIIDTHPCYEYHTKSENVEVCPYGYPY